MNRPDDLLRAGSRALGPLVAAGWDSVPFLGGAPACDDAEHGYGIGGILHRDRRAVSVTTFADGIVQLDGLDMPGPDGSAWAAAFEGRAELDVSGGPTEAQLRRFFEELGLLP